MTPHGETLQDHHSRIKELETALEHVLERLHQLEEKERQRAYDAHQHELNFDTWKEAREKYGSEGC